MKFLNDITNETIIITSNKTKILSEINNLKKLVNVKLMSVNEFRDKYYFSFDEKAIYYLMNKYNLKYEVSLSYLENLIYIQKNAYKSNKLQFLNELKIDLEDNNLLIKDQYFLKFLENKKIILLDNNILKFDKNMFEKVSKTNEVVYLNMLNPMYDHKTNIFETQEEEIEYIAYKISELLKSGISIDKIKLTNITQDYIDSIDKIFGFYNLKINLNKQISIYSTFICQKFLNNLKTSRDESLKSIEKYKNTFIYKSIVNLLNDLVWVEDLVKAKTLITEKLKRIKTESLIQTNLIEVVNYNDYIFEDEFVFMLNFNNEVIPITYKDEDYITDDMKEEIIATKTVDKNKNSKTTTINIIKSIKNLTITCKKTSTKETFYPSSLIQEFPLEEIKINDLVSYSELAGKIKLAKNLDNFIKYSTINEATSLLYSNYDINYGEYDNAFTGIKQKDLLEYLNDTLYLSYSSLDTYNKCAFRYYLSNILKLDIYEETFGAYIGSLFHFVLQNCLTEDKQMEEEIQKFIDENKRILNTKEKFYVNKLKKELSELLVFLKNQLQYTDLLDFMFEKKITIEKTNKTTCFFTGIIDKIMYKETSNETILSIIDYKTYSLNTDLRTLPLGLNMQLPIYLYLSQKLPLKNKVYAGFYTEQILNNSIISRDEKLYMLNGYSNSDQNILEVFDKTYNESKFISSLKTKVDGEFSFYSKVLNDKQIKNIINLTEERIDKIIRYIENVQFDINPKYIDKNVSCEFCKFKDICFTNPKDLIYLKAEKDLSFLGGETNE